MVNKSELKSSGLRSASGKGEYEFSSDIKNLPLLFWRALIADGRMAGDNTKKYGHISFLQNKKHQRHVKWQLGVW